MTAAEGSSPVRTYAGMTRSERVADRERRLLDAGFDLFGRLGYGEVTGDELCAAAGITGRNLYADHGGREGVMIALHRRLTDEALARVDEALDVSPSTAAGQIRAGVEAYIDFLLEDRRRFRIIAVECEGISAEVDDVRRESGERFADLVIRRAEQLPEGERPPVISGGWSPYARTRLGAGISLTHALIQGWTTLPAAPPREVLVEDIVSVTMHIASLPPA